MSHLRSQVRMTVPKAAGEPENHEVRWTHSHHKKLKEM